MSTDRQSLSTADALRPPPQRRSAALLSAALHLGALVLLALPRTPPAMPAPGQVVALVMVPPAPPSQPAPVPPAPVPPTPASEPAPVTQPTPVAAPISVAEPRPEPAPIASAQLPPTHHAARRPHRPTTPNPAPAPLPATSPAPLPAIPPAPLPAIPPAPLPATPPAPLPATPPAPLPATPPAPLPATAPSSGQIATARAAYAHTLATWLQAHKTYPEQARRNREQGRALLRFTIARDGQVSGLQFLAGTGAVLLDDALRQMLAEARLPPFPPGLDDAQMVVTIPIRFALDP